MSEDKCPKAATFSYLWPGDDEFKYCCSIHMGQISALGGVIGYPIRFHIIVPNNGRMCQNTLSKEDKVTLGIKS